MGKWKKMKLSKGNSKQDGKIQGRKEKSHWKKEAKEKILESNSRFFDNTDEKQEC